LVETWHLQTICVSQRIQKKSQEITCATSHIVNDLENLLADGCTVAGNCVYNEKGYRICAEPNQHDRPCQRIGRCPFHVRGLDAKSATALNGIVEATKQPQPQPEGASLPQQFSQSASLFDLNYEKLAHAQGSAADTNFTNIYLSSRAPSAKLVNLALGAREERDMESIPSVQVNCHRKHSRRSGCIISARESYSRHQSHVAIRLTQVGGGPHRLAPNLTRSGRPVSEEESVSLSPTRQQLPFKKGWTKEEHLRCLHGLTVYGRGSWKQIGTIVQSRTPVQIQSHAQKYFLRQKQTRKVKKSIHDLEPVFDVSTTGLLEISVASPEARGQASLKSPLDRHKLSSAVQDRDRSRIALLGSGLIPIPRPCSQTAVVPTKDAMSLLGTSDFCSPFVATFPPQVRTPGGPIGITQRADNEYSAQQATGNMENVSPTTVAQSTERIERICDWLATSDFDAEGTWII
jgi:SHAQKYF class myb-like DNA-binding protein